MENEQQIQNATQEIMTNIAHQVELYLSNKNISQDKFLLKQISEKNKDGFICIKLIISNCKSLKKLTKDRQLVAESIEKCSPILQLNSERNKVRRSDCYNLPSLEKLKPSRTLVVSNLPMNRPTKEGIKDLFKLFGDIKRVMIMRPGNPVPNMVKSYHEALRHHLDHVYSFIEFENDEEAIRCIDLINIIDSEHNMNIFLLGESKPDRKFKHKLGQFEQSEAFPNYGLNAAHSNQTELHGSDPSYNYSPSFEACGQTHAQSPYLENTISQFNQSINQPPFLEHIINQFNQLQLDRSSPHFNDGSTPFYTDDGSSLGSSPFYTDDGSTDESSPFYTDDSIPYSSPYWPDGSTGPEESDVRVISRPKAERTVHGSGRFVEHVNNDERLWIDSWTQNGQNI